MTINKVEILPTNRGSSRQIARVNHNTQFVGYRIKTGRIDHEFVLDLLPQVHRVIFFANHQIIGIANPVELRGNAVITRDHGGETQG
ncbi:Uncharacterised protein [Vibrio cholerae]|uniref:Uncharacterized protein n=1 Tax=Vibrio cholerae TaxID=666 RepID=A0A655R011_VIBCL|nr:Uncharacterised protein [Vibrio cholerae]CSA78628.1 Uncharacterised protein [Vibrio cholerae]CSB09169.1 Uncharacterised protein [Vibrio cholerae]CSB50767.1 Uncharacterised protein [Vibrio cholerae]